MSRLDGFFRKAEQAAFDLVEAVRFGIFGPPRRRELAVERMRIAGPADTEALRRALVESHRFLFPPFQETKPMKTNATPASPSPDPATRETVLISTPDVSRVMARIRAIAMGNPRETDVDGKPLPPLDLAILVLMLGSDLLNLREVHGATEEKRAEVTELLDELRTVSANDNRCNAEVIEKLRADLAAAHSLNTEIREVNTVECEVLRDYIRDQGVIIDKLKAAGTEVGEVGEGRGAMLEAGGAILDVVRAERDRLAEEARALRLERDEMVEHERATSLSISTLQGEIAGLNERLARTVEELDRFRNLAEIREPVRVEEVR